MPLDIDIIITYVMKERLFRNQFEKYVLFL